MADNPSSLLSKLIVPAVILTVAALGGGIGALIAAPTAAALLTAIPIGFVAGGIAGGLASVVAQDVLGSEEKKPARSRERAADLSQQALSPVRVTNDLKPFSAAKISHSFNTVATLSAHAPAPAAAAPLRKMDAPKPH